MCKHCGCESPRALHHHEHHGHHHHADSKKHGGSAGMNRVALETRILHDNDKTAESNRKRLDRSNVTAFNIMSSPGSGKTLLLEKTLTRLRGHIRCCVITGDVQTDNDARRLMGRGATVRQIETHGACHLDAKHIASLLPDMLARPKPRILFIENIGNLVCPSAFDLGEHVRIALLSVTEGEDKPLKYPSLFAQASVVVLTKTDLLPHLDFNMAACRKNLRRVKPDALVIETSARTGKGMDQWISYLEQLVS